MPKDLFADMPTQTTQARQPKDLLANMQQNQPQKPVDSMGSRALMGALDPVYGVGQLVPRGLQAITSLGGYAPNAVSDLYGQSYNRIDKDVKAREEAYNAPQGFDYARMAGNILSPVNVVGGAPASLGGKLAMGAALGATAPVQNTESYGSEKALQAGLGAAIPLAGATIGKILNPKTAPEVKTLLNEGVKLTPGEMAGGFAKRAEDALTSVFGVGHIIKGGQIKGIESLNTAAINRSLSPIGKVLPKGIKVGREAVQYAEEALGEVYDDLLPKLTGFVDNQFITDLSNVKNMVQSDYVMNNAAKAKFNKIVSELVENRVSKTGGITGEAIKEIESRLTDLTKTFGKSLDPSESQLSDALSEVQTTLRGMVERSNPNYAEQLRGLNTGWANFKRIQKAAAGVGAQDGIFTPAQLQTAVKAADRSKDKGAFARGSALMQDLSEPVKSIMASKIPNSGTTDRALAAAALYGLGGGAAYGATTDTSYAPYLAPVAAASLMYSPAGRRMAQALLTERPQAARVGGDLINKYAQYLSSTSARQGTE